VTETFGDRAKLPTTGSDATVLTADSTKPLGLRWAAPGGTYHASANNKVTESSEGDIDSLSISSVPAGTYMFHVAFVAGGKSGNAAVHITDGSNNEIWPASAAQTDSVRAESFTNADSKIQFCMSGIFTTSSTLTIKAAWFNVGAAGSWNIYDRHLTLILLG
jgi:hypothetical protein